MTYRATPKRTYRKSATRRKLCPLKTEKPKKKQSPSKIGTGMRFVLLVSLFLGVLVIAPPLSVQDVSVTGISKIAEDQATSVVLSTVFPALGRFQIRNVFLVKGVRTEQALASAFPLVQKADLTRELFRKIVVNVEEKRPQAVWCKDEDAAPCFFVDEKGIAFEEMNAVPDGMLEIRSSKTNDAGLRDIVIDPTVLQAIFSFRSGALASSTFQEEEWSISRAWINGTSKTRMTITNNTGSWEAYMDLSQDPAWQAKKLDLTIHREVPKEKRNKLEYIDVRFGNRAYVKYR